MTKNNNWFLVIAIGKLLMYYLKGGDLVMFLILINEVIHSIWNW